MRRELGPQAALLAFSLRFRGVVLALACMLLGYGVYTLQQAKYDVFPEFAPPQVTIQTEAPGLAPEQVEVLVTQPLENAIDGAPGLRALRSSSIQGVSVITTVFAASSDIYRDRQTIAERLAEAAAQLPAGVAAPVMTPLTSATSTVLVVGLSAARRSLMELRTMAEWTVRPRLLAVPGVAKIAIFGGEEKTLQVQLHPGRLVRFGLGLDEVLAAARSATGVRGGGFIDTPNQRIVLRAEGQSLTPGALARTVVAGGGGASLTLGDVATVATAPGPSIGAAAINGRPGVLLYIAEQYGANTIDVTQRLDGALADLQPALQRAGITLHPDLFRPADFINTATGNVGFSLLLGGILVVVVIFLFLFDVRTAAISCVAIPLSLMAAVIVLQHFDMTLNTMTLGGLAVAVGVVVDDAVVDIENIVRRLRENRRLVPPRRPAGVILDACLEVRGVVLYATLAVMLVVFPIIGLTGLAGKLFAPLGVAYALAVLASLVVTLTVVPALSAVLLTGEHLKSLDPPLMRWSKRHYRTLLHGIARHPRAAVLGAVMLTAAGGAMLPFFGGSFIPELNEGHFIVHMTAVPGTSLAASMRLGDLVTKSLLALPAVRSVTQWAGRAELADDINGPHYSEFEVDLKPLGGDEAETARADIRKAVARIPGANFVVNSFLTERIEETLSGYTASVVVNIFGHDLDALDARAQDAGKLLATIPGAADIQVQSPPGLPQLAIRLRKDELARWRLNPVEVLDAVQTAYEGQTVGETYDGNRVVPVVVILDPTTRSRVEDVQDLPLRAPDGSYVRLQQIADIYEESGRYMVAHQQAQRVQSVTANVVGRDVASFVRDARALLGRKVPLPAGSYMAFAGEAEAQSRSQRDLLVNSGIALAGIVLLLSIATRSVSSLLLVMTNLPFALVGGVFAVFASGGLLSLGSMVGFVALLGITLRNSILLVAHYEYLVASEERPWTLETAMDGATDRLAPILMTSLVTALGVLPLAIGMNEPGREIEGPMAMVILGGLLTSMMLNLLVLPILALRFGRFGTAGAQEASFERVDSDTGRAGVATRR